MLLCGLSAACCFWPWTSPRLLPFLLRVVSWIGLWGTPRSFLESGLVDLPSVLRPHLRSECTHVGPHGPGVALVGESEAVVGLHLGSFGLPVCMSALVKPANLDPIGLSLWPV